MSAARYAQYEKDNARGLKYPLVAGEQQTAESLLHNALRPISNPAG